MDAAGHARATIFLPDPVYHGAITVSFCSELSGAEYVRMPCPSIISANAAVTDAVASDEPPGRRTA